METFDLESHLQDAYSRFPEAKHQPVIGLTANYEGIDATLRDRYYKQVIGLAVRRSLFLLLSMLRSSSIPWSILMD